MKKKKFIIIGIIIIVIVILIGLLSGQDIKRTSNNMKKNGEDSYTLMIYMCASDLESDGGYASTDISEMLSATLNEKVNIIIETGGTSQWQKYDISNNNNQIYKIENGELKLIKDLELESMTEPSTLLNFINFCKDNYSADRYSLILWDHGGGAVSGYGYDENNSNKEDTLTIDELKQAVEGSSVKFDFIGFDACLMANIETAYSIRNNANYLIASEETEPGSGWDYTNLLNKISDNTSDDTVDIAKVVVDNFIESNNDNGEEATLSVVDLSKMDDVFSKLNEFISEIKVENLDNKQFANISKAVGKSKSYADGQCDTIDLVDFAKNVNNANSDSLIEIVKGATVYNKTTDKVKSSNGLSIYFPYKDLSYYEKMLKIYPKIGISNDYTNALTTFVNILVGGKNGEYTINSHTYSTGEDYSQYEWYNQNIIDQNSENYDENEYNELKITDKGDYYALKITDDDWENIVGITCEVLYDDDEGYVDLGSDDYYEVDNDGDLKITFDGTWISINNQVVPFYSTEVTKEYSKGKVPAYLNDELVNLIVIWDEKNPNGKVLGAEEVNDYGDTTISQKGLTKINKGDKLKFVFDYYKYNGEYEDSYIIGDELTVDDENLSVNYNDVGDGKFYVYYKIIDIYGNEYYTESVIF